MKLNYPVRPRPPWFVPVAIATVLFLGSFINNEVNLGNYVDTYLTAIWLLMLLGAYGIDRRQDMKETKKSLLDGKVGHIYIEPAVAVRIIAVLIQLASLYHYTVAGVPLFSVDPDSARMEFMQSTITFKILKVYVPFFIIFYVSWIILNPRRKILDYALVALMIFQFAVSGGKGAFIWILVYLALAVSISGKRIDRRIVIFGLALGAVVTLLLFKVVAGIDNVPAAAAFIYERLTSIAEYGLYVATQKLGADFSSLAPFNFVFNLFDKYINNAYEGYTPSLGREVTAYFYGGDVYGYLWEITVTMLGDFYILAGVAGVLFGCLAYVQLMRVVWNRGLLASSLYKKSLFATLWFHMVLYSLTGSIVTEFFVRTVPLIVFWFSGHFLLRVFKGSRNRQFRVRDPGRI